MTKIELLLEANKAAEVRGVKLLGLLTAPNLPSLFSIRNSWTSVNCKRVVR